MPFRSASSPEGHRRISVNAVVLEALSAEIERVQADPDFMDRLRRLMERDKEILDRLAQ